MTGFIDTSLELAWDLVVAGNYAYVADREGKLRIADVADPANPAEAGSFDKLALPNDVAMSGN
jgi:hypothetical protein